MPFLFSRGTRTVLLVDEISQSLAFLKDSAQYLFGTAAFSDPRIKAGGIALLIDPTKPVCFYEGFIED